MDLDNVKKIWQVNHMTTDIDDKKIMRMIDTRGTNAYEGLVKYERFCCFLIAACMLFLPIFWKMHIYLFAAYLFACLLGGCWQLYKYKKLKEINLSEMTVLEVSIQITRYRKYITKELTVALIWLISFIFIFMYYVIVEEISQRHPIDDETTYIVIGIGIVMFLVVAGIAYATYKLAQMKRVKTIEKALEEIKYFEEGNN